MKKFILTMCLIIVLGFSCLYAYYYLGVYVDFDPNAPVTTFMKADEDTIYMERELWYQAKSMKAGTQQWQKNFRKIKKTMTLKTTIL